MEILTLLAAGLANGSLYALVGLGLVLVYNAQGIPNFAHGEFFMVGAFIGYIAFDSLGLPYALSIFVALAGGGFIGMVVEIVAIRAVANSGRLTSGAREIALVMITVGLSVALKGFVRLPFGDRVRDFPPVVDRGSVTIGGVVINPQHLLIVAVAALLAGAAYFFLRYARQGKRMRATAENPVGARIVGINVSRVYALTWAIAAALGAAAGILAAPMLFLDPDMGSRLLLKGFAAAVLGGFGSVPGVIVGGLIMGIVEMLCGRYVSTALLDISSFLVIMLVLLFMPMGLFGARRVSRV